MFERLITTRRLQLSQRDPWLRVARISLLLLLLMIVISPITQSIWAGDNFLQGQDTETTLVVGLTIAAVAVLRMRRSKTDIDETLKRLRNVLSLFFGAFLRGYVAGFMNHFSLISAVPHSRGRPEPFTGYHLPLLI